MFFAVVLTVFGACKDGDNGDDASSNFATVKDVDGNTYRTVTIGTQTWMTENLRVTHYYNGVAIARISQNDVWGSLTTGAYCWYNNDYDVYEKVYGALCNWYAVKTGKLAPKGWQVPTKEDWMTLFNFLGGESVAGGKLKETGNVHWYGQKSDASNITGFTALPGGYRFDGSRLFDVGRFYDMCYYCHFWGNTEFDNSNACSCYISFYYGNVFFNPC